MEVQVAIDDKLKAQIRDMRAHFLVPAQPDEVCAELDAAAVPLSPEYQRIANNFRHSLASTLSTVSMPFALAYTSAYRSHFQRIHMAERIRALPLDEDAPQPGEDLGAVQEREALRDREAFTKADIRMDEFVESEDGKNALSRDTCEFLLTSLKHGLEPATQELIQQGLVLLWSAFEVFCRDTFETLLNGNPAKVQALINHPSTRKRFEAERLPLDTLLQHGFDLSARLGTVLVSQQDFTDLRAIKAVFAVLFPGGTDLNSALARRELWTLYQRRHLVVHRRAVIDQAYLDATGETSPIGTRLVVKPQAFEAALGVVVSAGTELVRALAVDSPA
jgi:hypothetical protein